MPEIIAYHHRRSLCFRNTQFFSSARFHLQIHSSYLFRLLLLPYPSSQFFCNRHYWVDSGNIFTCLLLTYELGSLSHWTGNCLPIFCWNEHALGKPRCKLHCWGDLKLLTNPWVPSQYHSSWERHHVLDQRVQEKEKRSYASLTGQGYSGTAQTHPQQEDH